MTRGAASNGCSRCSPRAHPSDSSTNPTTFRSILVHAAPSNNLYNNILVHGQIIAYDHPVLPRPMTHTRRSGCLRTKLPRCWEQNPGCLLATALSSQFNGKTFASYSWAALQFVHLTRKRVIQYPEGAEGGPTAAPLPLRSSCTT